MNKQEREKCFETFKHYNSRIVKNVYYSKDVLSEKDNRVILIELQPNLQYSSLEQVYNLLRRYHCDYSVAINIITKEKDTIIIKVED